MNSSNIVVKTITNMGIYGLYTVMEANKIFLQSKFYMEEINVYEMWKQKVNSESDKVRLENCVSGGINVIAIFICE